MKSRNDRGQIAKLETNGRREMIVMHLFDEDARDGEALWGADTSLDDRRSVNGYLNDRLDGVSVGTVCERCKPLAVPFAVHRIRGLEAETLPDEAEEYCQLVSTLLREVGPFFQPKEDTEAKDATLPMCRSKSQLPKNTSGKGTNTHAIFMACARNNQVVRALRNC